jgi:cysteine-rich repeat protein
MPLSRLALSGAVGLVLFCVNCAPREEDEAVTVPPPLPSWDAQAAQPAPVCGNQRVEQGEACDDGNARDGDYCAADCSAKTGSCGDGVWQKNESCEGSQGFFGACTPQCTPRIGARCQVDAGVSHCEVLPLSGLPLGDRVADLTASQFQPICAWLNAVKAVRRKELGSGAVQCPGFRFTFDEENCARTAYTGQGSLRALGSESCDMSVLEYERCQLETLYHPCQTIRLEQDKVRLISPCWQEGCASPTPAPVDAGVPPISQLDGAVDPVDAGTAVDAQPSLDGG